MPKQVAERSSGWWPLLIPSAVFCRQLFVPSICTISLVAVVTPASALALARPCLSTARSGEKAEWQHYARVQSRFILQRQQSCSALSIGYLPGAFRRPIHYSYRCLRGPAGAPHRQGHVRHFGTFVGWLPDAYSRDALSFGSGVLAPGSVQASLCEICRGISPHAGQSSHQPAGAKHSPRQPPVGSGMQAGAHLLIGSPVL